MISLVNIYNQFTYILILCRSVAAHLSLTPHHPTRSPPPYIPHHRQSVAGDGCTRSGRCWIGTGQVRGKEAEAADAGCGRWMVGGGLVSGGDWGSGGERESSGGAFSFSILFLHHLSQIFP